MPTPFYLLVAAPATATRLRSFAREGSDSPGWLLTQPPVIRHAGFDTSTRDVAQLVGGERWEAQYGDRKVLRLYQDGSLLFRMRADEEFLAWALQSRAHYGEPTLNAVAVVESHLSFVYLVKELLPWFKEQPAEIRFTLRFSDAQLRDRPLTVSKYVDPNRGWLADPDLHPIHGPSAEESLNVAVSRLAESPEAVAYDLLVRFYDMFDAAADLIPFLRDTPQGKAVDADALKAL
jgi:hypothetical protein